MFLRLPLETANQILGYLSTRPYNEVYQLIQAIQAAAMPPQPHEPQNGNQVDPEGNQ